MSEFDTNPPDCEETNHVCHVGDFDSDTWQVVRDALPLAVKRNSDRDQVRAYIDLALAERGVPVPDIVLGRSDFLYGVVQCIAQDKCPRAREN